MTDRKEATMTMTEERFQALVAAYGADPLRWPDGERASALRLEATDTPAIQSALEEAAAIDALLNDAEIPTLSANALERLRHDARPGFLSSLRGILGWGGPLWQPAGALTAALVLGLGLGLADLDGAAGIVSLSAPSIDAVAPDLVSGDGL